MNSFDSVIFFYSSIFIFFFIFSVEDLFYNKICNIVIVQAFIVNLVLCFYFYDYLISKTTVAGTSFKLIFIYMFRILHKRSYIGGGDFKMLVILLFFPVHNNQISLLFCREGLVLNDLFDTLIIFIMILLVIFVIRQNMKNRQIRKVKLAPILFIALVASILL